MAGGGVVSCMDCQLPYEDFLLDTTLPHNQWSLIHDSEGGLLCANCMVKRASKIPGAIACRMVIDIRPSVGRSTP